MMCWVIFPVLLSLLDYCESKAGFLSNIPLDAEDVSVSTSVLPANYPDFDADSKIPGRYVPRLPYHHLPQHVFYQQEEHLQHHPSRSHHNPYPQLDYPISSSSDTQYQKNHQHPHRHHHQHQHHHHQHSASVGHQLEELRDEPQDFPITRRSNRQQHVYEYEPSVSVDNGPRALGIVATGVGSSNTVDSHHAEHSQRGGGQHGGGGVGVGVGVGGHRGGGGYTYAHQGFQDVKETYTGPSTPPRPKFDLSLPRNITVQRGKTAVLSCRVLNQGDKSVSWIRSDSLAILAVDKYKYSTDQRLSVVYNEPNLEWVLRIRGVRTNDSGIYECQVSTKPVISFLVNMDVVDPVRRSVPYPKMSDQQQILEPVLVKTEIVPRATIINGPEIFVHHGSLINLTCLVTHGTRSPVFVYWYHHNQVIDYNWRTGVTVTTEQARDTTSHLQVTHAQLNDSGKYICRPNHGEEASVRLHVLSGEYQAAMQTNTSTRISWIPAMFILGTCLGALLSVCTCPHS